MTKRHIGWLFTMFSVAVDAVLIILGFNFAWWLRYVMQLGGQVGNDYYIALDNYAGMRLGLLGVILLVFVASGIYRMPRGRSFIVDVSQIVHALLTAVGLLVIALFVVRIPFSSRLLLGFAGTTLAVMLLSVRLLRFACQVQFRVDFQADVDAGGPGRDVHCHDRVRRILVA